jgi:hypothetical protein
MAVVEYIFLMKFTKILHHQRIAISQGGLAQGLDKTRKGEMIS